MDWCHGMRDYCCFDRLNMDPVDYQIIVGWIRASGLKRMPTLGRRSYIDVSYEPGGHLLVTGRNGARKSITVDCQKMRKNEQDDMQIETGTIQITFLLRVFQPYADTIKNTISKVLTFIIVHKTKEVMGQEQIKRHYLRDLFSFR